MDASALSRLAAMFGGKKNMLHDPMPTGLGVQDPNHEMAEAMGEPDTSAASELKPKEEEGGLMSALQALASLVSQKPKIGMGMSPSKAIPTPEPTPQPSAEISGRR